MKTITLNDNHIAHLNAKNTTKLEYLNLSNNNLLPTNDIDQLISSKHLWHVLVNGINNDPLAQMQYWTAVRNIIDDTNEVTIDLSGLNLTTQPPGLQNFTSINLDNNQLTHFDATNYDRLVKLSLNSNALESINFPQGRNVSITHISMNNNALRNIDIDRLSSVTYFSAAHNQLEFVQLESCEWLQYLNLSHNQLTDIVAGNKNELLLLDLSHNKLTSLHNTFFPNLNTLLINNNLLSEIKIFFSNFCNIQTLNAANNQLEKINLHFLTYLSSIKSLRLDNNKITRIDTKNTSTDWAATITGIPQARIVQLAREIASAKPAYISQGWGPQRHANGELVSRAISMLAILTGNVGINGGNTGAREGSYSLPFERMPTLDNPVETSISMFMWTDAIERGTEMTALRDGVRGKDKLDVPIKMVWNYAGNCLINQHSEINRTHDILQDDKKCEMIVVIDCHMTSSAKYADILLPDCTASEQMDFALDASCGNMSYVIFADQAIKPRFECKTIYEMTSELAKRMGVEQRFTEGRTQEEWLRHLYEQSRKAIPALLPFDEFRKQGIFKQRDPEGHHVAYKAFREDPAANPLTTPSGKIEIYSAQLAEIAATWELKEQDVIDPLPIYSPGFENYDDPLAEKYPLQLTGFHYKARTHSTYGNVDVLKAACRQEMWINPLDAQKRGIANGDRIRIFNDRGEVHIEAKVTPRMIPGVVALGEGAWYNPDAGRVDQAGSINVLTTQRPSPLAKGNPSHTNLVQVEKL